MQQRLGIHRDYYSIFGNLRKSSFLADEEKQNSFALSAWVFPCNYHSIQEQIIINLIRSHNIVESYSWKKLQLSSNMTPSYFGSGSSQHRAFPFPDTATQFSTFSTFWFLIHFLWILSCLHSS